VCYFYFIFAPSSAKIRREKFSELVARANAWLFENRDYCAVFCQTVSFYEPPKQKRLRRHKPDSTVLKIGYSFGHVFGLRVWLGKNATGFPQKLQYFDTVPELYVGQFRGKYIISRFKVRGIIGSISNDNNNVLQFFTF
jgi:hypothetical protein